jgi:hypothetical protein
MSPLPVILQRVLSPGSPINKHKVTKAKASWQGAGQVLLLQLVIDHEATILW